MKCDSSMALEATQGHRGSSGDLGPAGKVEETRKGLGVARRESWLTKPMTLCDQKVGSVDEGRTMDTPYLDFSKAFDTLLQHPCR